MAQSSSASADDFGSDVIGGIQPSSGPSTWSDWLPVVAVAVGLAAITWLVLKRK